MTYREGMLTVLCVLLFAACLYFIVMLYDIHANMKSMREVVAKCEQNLPRNQTCRLVFTAKVVK